MLTNGDITIDELKRFTGSFGKTQMKASTANIAEPAAVYSPSVKQNVPYMHSFPMQKQEILKRVNSTSSSEDLAKKLLQVTGLPITYVADEGFEINPETFNRYKNEPRKIPALIVEQAIKIIELYNLGTELFGSKQTFNLWLQEVQPLMGNMQPIE